MTPEIFAPGFKEAPFWWEEAPLRSWPEEPLPERVDVAVIGSGLVGLNCARLLARGGRTVLVLEAQDPGYGASTRLAGHIGRTPRVSFAKTRDKFGLERAIRLFQEAVEAQQAIRDVIAEENIEAGLLWRGRFAAACTSEHYEAILRNVELVNKYVPLAFFACPRSEQRQEVGTDYYFGGVVIEDYGILHSAKYHRGLLDAAIRAGAAVAAQTAVRHVATEGTQFRIRTSRGDLVARDVAICTNGYTDTVFAALPWVRRRIIPIPAFQICTEVLAPELMKRVMPTGRPITDSKENIYWVRPTPDDKRLIFGARTGHDDGDLKITAQKLRALLVEVYPELKDVRLTHAWQGVMGFTFDKWPHIGQTPDRAYYATGFCGAGLALGTHLGQKLAHRILGHAEGETAYWGTGFPTWPFYGGRPWFMPLVLAWIDVRDGRARRRAVRSAA
ncbi:MAG TPA: FAD-binding oxidoreductase [Alphaproteobacteria bacterium]|nr:FAD-binding oxidoreductase [Alphaproteobacteria bacterium]